MAVRSEITITIKPESYGIAVAYRCVIDGKYGGLHRISDGVPTTDLCAVVDARTEYLTAVN